MSEIFKYIHTHTEDQNQTLTVNEENRMDYTTLVTQAPLLLIRVAFTWHWEMGRDHLGQGLKHTHR